MNWKKCQLLPTTGTCVLQAARDLSSLLCLMLWPQGRATLTLCQRENGISGVLYPNCCSTVAPTHGIAPGISRRSPLPRHPNPDGQCCWFTMVQPSPPQLDPLTIPNPTGQYVGPFSSRNIPQQPGSQYSPRTLPHPSRACLGWGETLGSCKIIQK